MTEQVRNADGELVKAVTESDLFAWLKRLGGWALSVGIVALVAAIVNWSGIENRLTNVEKAQAQDARRTDEMLDNLGRLVKTFDSLVVVLQNPPRESASDRGRRR